MSENRRKLSMEPIFSTKLIEMGSKAVAQPAASFSELLALKFFGKSIARLRAEAAIETDKALTGWDQIEKPLWIQAELKKTERQYNNLGSVIDKAFSEIESPESHIEDDNDFFWGLMEHAKEISSEQMQEVIAKILAGEYNNPGSYSMSSLQTIKNLGKEELELFKLIGELLLSNEQLPKNLFTGDDHTHSIVTSKGLDFGSLQTLQNLGLFLPNDMTNAIKNPERKKFRLTYQDRGLDYEAGESAGADAVIKLPEFYGLSSAGKQIIKHLDISFREDYFDWLKKNYRIPNYTLVATP